MTSALDINAEQQASIYQLAVGRYRDMFTGEDRPSPLLLSGEMSFNPAATFYMTSAGLLSSGYQNIRVQNLYSGWDQAWFSAAASYANTKDAGQGYQFSVQNQMTINGNFGVSWSSVYGSANYWLPDDALSSSNNLNDLMFGN